MQALDREILRRLFIVVVAANACLGSNALGADNRDVFPNDGWHFRYDLFQMLIEERGLRVLSAIDQALSAPEDSVLVIAGATPRQLTAADWSDLMRFVAHGGALLLASDTPLTVPGFGRFSNGPVTTADPRHQYQGFVDCLRISPTPTALPTLAGVAEIVTNRSGWFEPQLDGRLNWEVVAELPRDCRPVPSQQQPLIAVGRSSASQPGLAIVSADASLFTNGMLWHGDNAIAAIRISALLCGTAKTQLCFMSDGQVRDTYRSRIAPPPRRKPDAPKSDREFPEPELASAMRLANAVAKEVAASNLLNEALRRQPRRVDPAAYYRAILHFAALLFLFGALWMLLASGTGRSAFLPPRRMRAAFEMRGDAGSGVGDYRTSAGYLAREFCLEWTGSRHSGDWQRHLSSMLSKSSSLDSSERQELSRVVDIACRGCQVRLSSRDFQLLGKSLNGLRARHITDIHEQDTAQGIPLVQDRSSVHHTASSSPS